MLTLRPMSEPDFEAVARLDVLAFSPYFQQSGGGQELPPRTHDNLRACLNIFPGGCWVAVADEQPVGYVFSRVWGKLGWLGVFGVSPEAQGQRIGQLLLATVVQALQAAGCETVGLETMPDSPYNVGLYASQGFWITAPTLNLHKEFTTPPPTAAYTCLSDVDLSSALAEVAQVSGAVQPGLDYTAEVRNAHEYQWGETLLFGWPDTWGFAVIRTIARREGQ